MLGNCLKRCDPKGSRINDTQRSVKKIELQEMFTCTHQGRSTHVCIQTTAGNQGKFRQSDASSQHGGPFRFEFLHLTELLSPLEGSQGRECKSGIGRHGSVLCFSLRS